jgi:hypothetical protein
LSETDEARLALKLKSEHDNAVAWDRKNWDRCVDNWRLYWGIDSALGIGQWPADVASEMLRQRRQVATYNMVGPITDNIVGNIENAPFGADFIPVDSSLSSLTFKAKDILYCERELMDYRSQEHDLITGGLVYQGVWEMFINRKFDKKFGSIDVRTCLPGEVIFDPHWKDSRSSRCKKALRRLMLTPMQMLEVFHERRKEIVKAMAFKKYGDSYLEVLRKYEEMYGQEYGVNTGVIPYDYSGEEWGTQLQLIEYYHMERITTQYDYYLLENSEKVRLPSYLKDAAAKMQWLNEHIPDWRPDAVFSDEEEESVQFVTIMCPTLSQTMLLSHGPTEIQCGRLQFFPWSAKRINGENAGNVDNIKDWQRNINYWESLLVLKIQTEGGGGAQWIDPAAVDPAEAQRYVRNRNNPQEVFRMKPGMLKAYPNGPAIPVAKSGFPAEAMEHLKHMIEVIGPRISKVSPASQGRAESSQESGYLYRLKKLQSDIEQHTFFESLRNFWNEFYEAWLMQAIHTYGNGLERKFYNPRTKKETVINKHEIGFDEQGNIIESIVDDIGRLKDIRHRIMITESEDSPTRKVEIMQTSTELLKVIPQSKPLTIQELAHTLAKQLDAFNDEQKAQMDEYHQVEIEAALQDMKAKIAQSKLLELQSINSMTAFQQAMAGGGAVQTDKEGNPIASAATAAAAGGTMAAPGAALPAHSRPQVSGAAAAAIPTAPNAPTMAMRGAE